MGADTAGDGYVSPEFDLGSTSEHDDPPKKRQKIREKSREDPRESLPMSLMGEEALALALLHGQ